MPYESDAQRRWAHTKSGKKALGGEKKVEEWDKESKGLKLPEMTRWQCVECGAVYAEYVNGCPKCWHEHQKISKVVAVSI